MLLTLAVSSLRSLVHENGQGGMNLIDVPRFAMRELLLRGLNVPSSMLAGMSLADLDRLRDAADKEACPCLLLIGDEPLRYAGPPGKVEGSRDLFQRLSTAAHRLGCNSMVISCAADDTEESFELTATGIKESMASVERLELNVLIRPQEGLTADPTRMTELIKRIGGFRIGSLPTFEHAASTGDLESALRRLAPYAGAMHATIHDFDAKGGHPDYDLAACVQAIRSVGYANTLAIEYAGHGDPVANIDQARVVLTDAIEAGTGG
ncbi:MAG: hypothetical protein KDA22_02665 [Phycisphaerales bacterium]|nr:hypothetical protein [Phycisphaerales bacterium]